MAQSLLPLPYLWQLTFFDPSMKLSARLLLLFFSLSLSELSAQKNTVLLDLHYVPCRPCEWLGATAGYYRQISARRSLGMKFLYSTNAPGLPAGDVRGTILMTDITHRYSLAKRKKARWFCDAGISLLTEI